MKPLLAPSLGLALLYAGCGQEYTVVQPPEINPEDVTECPFTPISGTRFQRYDCNPVFAGSDEDWATNTGSIGFHAEEVLGHPFYQMWYATGLSDNSGIGLGYAVSANGVDWEPLETNPTYVTPPQGWNRDSLGATTVVWDSVSKQYVLQYQGINLDTDGNGLGMLTSPDGRTWTEANNGDPLLNLSDVVGGVVYCWPLALTFDADLGYQGYIGGSKGTQSNKCEVYYYGGADLESIRPDNDAPVLKAGQGFHDEEGVASAAVVKFEDTFYMFYVGINRWEPLPGTNFIYPYNTSLNMATSSDGVNWTKSEDNPLLDVSVVNETPFRVGTVAAQVVGPRIHLWIDDYYPDLDANAVGYFLYEPSVEKHP